MKQGPGNEASPWSLMTSTLSAPLALVVHAAIMAINEALDKEDPEETMKALTNPNACLVKLETSNSQRYHDTLLHAKKSKAAKSGTLVSPVLYTTVG